MGKVEDRIAYIDAFVYTNFAVLTAELDNSVCLHIDRTAIAEQVRKACETTTHKFVGNLGDEVKGRLACAGAPADDTDRFTIAELTPPESQGNVWRMPGARSVHFLATSAVLAAICDKIYRKRIAKVR